MKKLAMKNIFISLIILMITLSTCPLGAQTERQDTVIFAGKKMLRIITARGDTVYVGQLDEFTVKSYKFGSKEEYDRYMKYRRYAAIVYPYALEAMRIHRETEESTKGMTKREKKKFMNQLEDELENQFEEPLKKLTRTQGLILTKMIEKEMDMSFHSFIKKVKGSWSAFYWNTSGRFYGYHLKDGYQRGEDRIMDIVLDEYKLSPKTN